MSPYLPGATSARIKYPGPSRAASVPGPASSPDASAAAPLRQAAPPLDAQVAPPSHHTAALKAVSSKPVITGVVLKSAPSAVVPVAVDDAADSRARVPESASTRLSALPPTSHTEPATACDTASGGPKSAPPEAADAPSSDDAGRAPERQEQFV